MPDEIVYQKKSFLLTLQGRVTLQMLDGQVLEGELATQDDLHVFLRIADAPVMIPRQHIRFIKGQAGQPIVIDTSQDSPMIEPNRERQTTEPSVAVNEAKAAPLDLEKRPREETGTRTQASTFDLPKGPIYPTDDYEGTVILDNSMPQSVEDSGGTMMLSESEDVKNYDATVILDDLEKTPSPFAQNDMDGQATFILDEPAKFKAPPQLVCTGGPHAGQSYVITGSMTLGRASGNEVPLVNDKEISRRHAVVTIENGRYVLQDQNSLNGTFVNDHPIIGQYYLQHGDKILVGVSYLEFREV